MYTTTSGMSIKERVKTRAHKRDITKAIGVGKFGLDRFETYSQTDPNLSV